MGLTLISPAFVITLKNQPQLIHLAGFVTGGTVDVGDAQTGLWRGLFDGFKAAESALGYTRLVEVVGAIGHFCATAMMANVVGVTPAADAPSHLKKR